MGFSRGSFSEEGRASTYSGHLLEKVPGNPAGAEFLVPSTPLFISLYNIVQNDGRVQI